MKFLALSKKLKGAKVVGKGNPVLSGISENSKATQPGELFVCIPGAKADGRAYAEEAVQLGAKAVVVQENPLKGLAVPQLVVKDSREAIARLAHFYYVNPSKKVKTIGVTGTKGKTTTTYLIRAILERVGQPAGLIGTIAYQIGSKVYEANNTTPSSLTIVKLLDEMRRQKCKWAVMEVSSHALEMKRVLGVEFAGAVFTNLGRDHLDYHKNFANYFLAKRRLFTEFKTVKARAVNADDPYGQKLLRELKSKAVGYGIKNKCAYRATNVEHKPGLIRFEVQGQKFEAPLTGLFHPNPPVAVLHQGLGNAPQDVPQNGRGFFRPGIVRCHYRQVGQLGGNLPHEGSFGFVPIPTTSKDRNQPVMALFPQDLPGGNQGLFQCVGGMGVIHQNREFLSRRNFLEPSRNGGSVLQAVLQRFPGKAQFP